MQLESFLEQSAQRFPRKTALVCDRQRLTYAELESAANCLARALIEKGIRRGDRVAIHMDNSPQAVIAMFAILKAGAVFLIINPTTKTKKLTYILNNCRARAIVLPERKLSEHEELVAHTPHLEMLIVTNSTETVVDCDGKSCFALEALIEDHSHCSQAPGKRAIDVDVAALVYTSGSTGNPKGVTLSHRNMVSAATSITTYLEKTPHDIILSVLPLAFDYGLYQVLMSAKVGATLVLERSFAFPHAVMQRLVEERVTGFPLVPTMAALLLQTDLRPYDLGRLRFVTNTGAALPTDHIRQLRELFPHVAVYSMYGLTECKRVSYLPPDQIDQRPGSVGKAMPNTEVYLVNEEGRRLPPGEEGELVVRGSNVMLGYWEMPEETEKMLKPGPLPGERVLHTGDFFRMDEDGYLYFLGREDDIIKCRGEKVSPKEVENVLCEHPSIAEAAVVGVPDELQGQSIGAMITLKNGRQLSEKEALRHCADHLENFMVPRAIRILQQLPKTSNGKIDKRALEHEFSGAEK